MLAKNSIFEAEPQALNSLSLFIKKTETEIFDYLAFILELDTESHSMVKK